MKSFIIDAGLAAEPLPRSNKISPVEVSITCACNNKISAASSKPDTEHWTISGTVGSGSLSTGLAEIVASGTAVWLAIGSDS